jgi:hypothetical protein
MTRRQTAGILIVIGVILLVGGLAFDLATGHPSDPILRLTATPIGMLLMMFGFALRPLAPDSRLIRR